MFTGKAAEIAFAAIKERTKTPPDDIYVNSKTKEVVVNSTEDKFDRVFVDGKLQYTADKGKVLPKYQKWGFRIYDYDGPEGVGDGSFWGALLLLGGEKIGSWLYEGVSGWFAKRMASSVIENLIPEGNLANHLFKGTDKLLDNAVNRALIQESSNGTSLGVDQYGKSWFMGVDEVGRNVYSYAQHGIVRGAGYATMSAEEMIVKYNLKLLK
jgi:hypothetical protein